VLAADGIGFAAICSNDATDYPDDSFAKYERFALAHKFPFPIFMMKARPWPAPMRGLYAGLFWL